MSTKDLSKTIIEGGRDRWNRNARWRSNGAARAVTRSAMADATDWDALTVPERKPVGKAFHDKLGPPRRWLRRQIGRPWNAVRSDLLALFDPRTTAGRHIVFDHMLPWVDEGHLEHRGWPIVTVDIHGTLRTVARDRLGQWSRPAPLPLPKRDLERWLAGRRVDARGEALFWFTCTAAGAYRQHHRLDDEDTALWRSLPDWFREQHVPTAPPPAAPRTKV
jgi:hypothetical protein